MHHQPYVKIPIHCQWWYKRTVEERGVKLLAYKHTQRNCTTRSVCTTERMENAQQQLIGSKSIISTVNYAHKHVLFYYCRSRWPRGLRRGSAAASLLGLWVRILSATGQSLVQKSPNECGASECDLKISRVRRPWPTGDCRAMVEYIYIYI